MGEHETVRMIEGCVVNCLHSVAPDFAQYSPTSLDKPIWKHSKFTGVCKVAREASFHKKNQVPYVLHICLCNTRCACVSQACCLSKLFFICKSFDTRVSV
ncbi:Hypothetical predicted protein [Podarcis lilfordi]|uniref:Uncharacterized protein n=1 Tax=Podarcis lilfordi TaxID=74358 RepID=A0AA35KTK7_9SAUR|nr:Hypothetical predicted protein [Podarcis lilfordi]